MLSVLYAGSPEASAIVLERLLSESHCALPTEECIKAIEAPPLYKIAGVLTNPPSAQGRHKTLISTPASQAAAKYGIPIFTPQHLDAAFRAEISTIKADILVCFAYGHIFGPKFLSLFPMGGVNLHPSLLPRYRGATPVPAAILNRDKETAVTVQRLALGMDEGNILAQEIIPLDGTETAGELLKTCAQKGADLLVSLLKDTAVRGALSAGTAQLGESSYTKVITKENAHIDWGMSADDIDAFIRAYTPAPIAWTVYRGGTLKILGAHIVDALMPKMPSNEAHSGNQPGTVLCYQKGEGIMVQTGGGVIAITHLQRQGKKAIDAASFINGGEDIIGAVLR